jgi:phage terminase small subunit
MKIGIELNQRQLAFALGYLSGMAAYQAYIAAGYEARGAAARANASRLLTNANICQYLEQHRGEEMKNFEVTREKVVEGLAAIAFSDIKDYLTSDAPGMYLKDLSSLEAAQFDALCSLKLDPHDHRRVLGIRLRDKTKALRLLGSYLGMFDRNRILNRT